ncbi:hypothetical protein C3L33_15728, partial [Rhododendron williamsianum]
MSPSYAHRLEYMICLRNTGMVDVLVDYGYLSYSTTESCLRDEFSTYGQVAEVKLVVDEDSKRSKGYRSRWFNTFISHFIFQYLDGRLVFVELAKPGRNAFRGYPKTCGPSPQEKIPVLSKRKKKEKISVPKQEEASE